MTPIRRLYQELAPLIAQSALMFVLRVGGALLTYVTQIFLARWMGAEGLGSYVFAFSWMAILGMTATLGFIGTTISLVPQEMERGNKAGVKGYIRFGRAIALSASLVIGGAAAIVVLSSDRLTAAYGTTPLLIAAIGVPIFAMHLFNTEVARARQWNILAYLPTSILRQALFFAGVGGVLIATGLVTTSVAVGLLVVTFFIVMMGQFLVLQGRLSKDLAGTHASYEPRKWMKAALTMMPAMIITWNFPTLNIAIAGILMGPSEVAIYNAAFRTSEILTFGVYAVYVAFSTKISAVYATEDRGVLQRLVTRQAQITFYPSVAGAIVLALIGEFALGLFGQRFLDGYLALTILLAGLVIFAFVSPAAHLLVISDRESTFLAVTVLSFSIAVIGNVILIPVYGINGAASAVLVSQVFMSISLYFIVRRVLNIDVSPFGFLKRRVSG